MNFLKTCFSAIKDSACCDLKIYIPNKSVKSSVLIQSRIRHIKRNAATSAATTERVVPMRVLSSSRQLLISDLAIGSWKLKNPEDEAKAKSRLIFHRNGTGIDNFYESDGLGSNSSLSAKRFYWSRIGEHAYKVNEEVGTIRFPNSNTMMIDDNEELFIRVS